MRSADDAGELGALQAAVFADRRVRVSRVGAVLRTEEPVIRRDGVGLAGLWEELRRQVGERPTPVRVLARVRRTTASGLT
jgi:hypothetical protein